MEPSAATTGAATETAPAKVNLSLHVVGRRSDGYHLLDGLVAFAAFGDELTVAEAEADRLDVAGPMAPAIEGQPNILDKVLAHARAVGERAGLAIPPLHVRLKKRLPVAAGIGGGSADAAALLRVLATSHPTVRDALFETCVSLGADVPMCLDRRPVRIAGIGDRVTPVPRAPALPIVLVNPAVPLSTPAVFAALQAPSLEAPPAVPPAGFPSFEALASYLDACRNDLEIPACRLAPVVGDALFALRGTGARIARMSGSGATCFGLFESEGAAAAARSALLAVDPHWFVVATTTYGRETEAPDR